MPTRSPRRSGRFAIADELDPADALAPLARLALAYAPARTRGDWLTWLALDARLANIVRGAREPMLAQLKLAWWRDRLAADPSGWPKGEPLFARLAGWRDAASLGPLVDGWEALLGEPPLGEPDLRAFAQGRAASLAALAEQLGLPGEPARAAAEQWALADLALGLSDAHEAQALQGLLDKAGTAVRLPLAMRPLAVLGGVTRRALDRGGAAALYRPQAYLAAIRIGLFGR